MGRWLQTPLRREKRQFRSYRSTAVNWDQVIGIKVAERELSVRHFGFDELLPKAHETLTYFAFPSNHWRQIKTNNPLERIIREIRRRTRVVGAFPDGHSALILVAARLRHIASTKWGTRRYLAMESLLNPIHQEAAA